MFTKTIIHWLIGGSLCLAALWPLDGEANGQPPQPREDARIEAIEDLASARFDAGLLEGTVLVAEGDSILFHRAYGTADRAWDRPNDTDTRFHIGSVGKQMTGALILQLVEEGKLDLDQTVSDVLPDYPDGQGSLVPIRTLLNHTSGIPNYTRLPEFQSLGSSAIEQSELLALFSAKPLEFEPGSQFSYNNSGFFLLSLIIERLEGKSFGQVAEDRLFRPLGLSDTGYLESRKIVRRFAHAYNWVGTEYVAETSTHESWILGNAMIYSDTDDLFRWSRALLDGEIFDSPETGRQMLDLPEGAERNYAFGLGNIPVELNGQTYRGLGHSGALGGFRSTQSLVPERGWTVIVLSNIGTDQNEFADKILRILAGENVEHAKPPISREIGNRAVSQDFDDIRSWFTDELGREAKRYSFDETGTNLLGYAFLDRAKIEAATLVFELNVLAHPSSANALDSLGEAYLAAGDKGRALEQYSKAYQLDPSNLNAKRIIAELTDEIGAR